MRAISLALVVLAGGHSLAAQDARTPLARSVPYVTLESATLWPEGIDVDPVSGAVYVTSIRHRTIVETRPGARDRLLWPMDGGEGAVLAVHRDAGGDELWVTVAGLPQMQGFVTGDTGLAALLRVRIRDGAVLRRLDLPRGRHVPGAVAVTPAGDVLISDSFQPVLYRLRTGAARLEEMRHPLFRSLQGIAVDPAGRVFVADYSSGLLRVDLPSGTVVRIADAPRTTSRGCDGIVWHRGAIVAIQNGMSPARVMRFSLHASLDSIVSARMIDRNVPLADEPTMGVVVGDDFYYVANSQWEKYTASGELREGARLASPVILRLRLER